MRDDTPKLRSDLRFTERKDLEVTIVGDPLLGQYHRIGPIEADVFSRFDGVTSCARIAAYLREKYQAEVDADEVLRFAEQARSLKLLDIASDPQFDGPAGQRALKELKRRLALKELVLDRGRTGPAGDFFQQAASHALAGRMFSAARALQAVLELTPDDAQAVTLNRVIFECCFTYHTRETSWFFYPIPLIHNPDRYLKVVARYLGWTCTPATALLAVLALVFCVSHWVSHWSIVYGTAKALLGVPSTVAFYALLIWVTGWIETFIHETMHGATCVRFGGTVRHMGLLWTGVGMGAYCDVSSTYVMQVKWHRIAVPLAGPVVNILLAALWTTLSLVTEDRALGQFATVKGAWNTLGCVWAMMPFFKDDYYYAISEAVGITNAMEKTGAFVTSTLSRRLFGLELPPPVLTPRERRFVLTYGVLNVTLTTLLIAKTLTVVFLYALEQLSGFSLILLVVMTTSIAGRRLRRLLSFLGKHRGQLVRSPSLYRSVAVGTVLAVGVAFVPVTRQRVSDCTVRRRVVPLEPKSAGVLAEFNAAVGTTVIGGQVIGRIRNDELVRELEACRRELRAVEEAERALAHPLSLEEEQLIRAEVAEAQQRHSFARAAAARVARLVASKSATVEELAAARQEVEVARGLAEAKALELKDRLSTHDQETNRRARAEVQACEARCAAAAARVQGLTLVAPVSGDIVEVREDSAARLLGSSVAERTWLVRIATAATAQAQFEVPAYELVGHQVGGRPVEVRLTGASSRDWNGTVETVHQRANGRMVSLEATLQDLTEPPPADATCSALITFGREPLYRNALRPLGVLFDVGFWRLW